MRTNGVTAGAMLPDVAICRRFSMYCMQSRSALMSYGLCSISTTTPSNAVVLMLTALPISGPVNGTKVGLPDSSALIAPLRRGISMVTLLSLGQRGREQLFRGIGVRDQALLRGKLHAQVDAAAIGRHAVRQRIGTDDRRPACLGRWLARSLFCGGEQIHQFGFEPFVRGQKFAAHADDVVDRVGTGAAEPVRRGHVGIG